MINNTLFSHPIRIDIALELVNNENGLTVLELVDRLEDVSQATLYRHIRSMKKENFLSIASEHKVRGVKETVYTLNKEALTIQPEDWHQASYEDKVNFITYYQLFIMHRFKMYESRNDQNQKELPTFSIADLHINDNELENFQSELDQLLKKYKQKEAATNHSRTVAISIIP